MIRLICTFIAENETPRSKLRGIKAEFAIASPAFALSRFGGSPALLSLQRAAVYLGEGE
jgi:hypothetical protein